MIIYKVDKSSCISNFIIYVTWISSGIISRMFSPIAILYVLIHYIKTGGPYSGPISLICEFIDTLQFYISVSNM